MARTPRSRKGPRTPARRLRGVSSIIAAAVVLPLLFFAFFVLYSKLVSEAEYGVRGVRAAVSEAVSQVESLEAYAYASGSTVYVKVSNTGYGDTYVSLLFITYTTDAGHARRFAVRFNTTLSPQWPVLNISVEGGALTPSGLLVEPGRSATITMSVDGTVSGIGGSLATALGRVFPLKRPPEASETVASTFIMFSFPSLVDLSSRSDVQVKDADLVLAPATPSEPGAGISTSGPNGPWCLYQELSSVQVSGTTYFTTLYIGFDPAWTQLRLGDPLYAVSVTATRLWGAGNLTVGSIRVDDLLASYDAVKVVIERFSGSISYTYYWYSAADGTVKVESRSNSANPGDVVGIKLYGQHPYAIRASNDVSYASFSGAAEKVYIYVRGGCGPEVSYTPYMLIGDFDNNGYPEMLFTTEDAYFDSWWLHGWWPDAPGNDIDVVDIVTFKDYVELNDYTTVPFTVVFRGYPIDSNRVAAIQVAVRYYFHDDAAHDEEEIETDEWVLRVGVYSAEEDKMVVWYDLTYQALSRYEDTYPPSWSHRVETVTLLVPQTGKTYYLAVELRDPYPSTSSLDDADLMVGIEYLSVIYMSQAG